MSELETVFLKVDDIADGGLTRMMNARIQDIGKDIAERSENTAPRELAVNIKFTPNGEFVEVDFYTHAKMPKDVSGKAIAYTNEENLVNTANRDLIAELRNASTELPEGVTRLRAQNG